MEENYKSPLSLIKSRPGDSHKGTFGTLTIVAGSEKMPGALCLCAMGALRSGVGLVKIAAHESAYKYFGHGIYEAVHMDLADIFTRKSDAYCIGCGAGWVYDGIMDKLLRYIAGKAVLDADCINYIAANINVLNEMRCEKVITPHPAEMSRLTGIPVGEIQNNRVKTALDFAVKHGCTVVLKGCGTVIASPDGQYAVNRSGNNGLAKGGSGDVLAGIIASLCAQGYSCRDAAVLGVYVHGLAADNLIGKYGVHGMLPRDICEEAGRILG